MAGRRKIEVSSDSGAPLGEKTSLDGSEYFPISGSQVAKISSVRTYIAPIDSDSTHFLDGTGQFNLVRDSHLSFTNITTNNADSDHHGFLPLLSGDSNTWLDGKGAWTTPPGSASIYDSDILFTDITTNNADSDHHGFLPKLSGDSDTFLSGKGLWETPTGGSGNVATDAIWDAKGDLAVGTGANTAARLAGGTDGQILTYDSAETTGMRWNNAGTGTLTPEYVTTAADSDLTNEVVIPGLAGSADRSGIGGAGFSYEFDSGTSPLSWSVAVDTEDVDTTVPSHLYVQDNGASESLGTLSWSPAGAFDVRCKLSMGIEAGTSASVVQAGLVVGDSAMNNRALVLLTFDGSTDQWSVRAYTYASSTYTQRGASNVIGKNVIYLRVVRDGSNNNSLYYSHDGITWLLVATQSLTYTAAKAGFLLIPSSLTTSIAVDHFRANV